jgi:hypothetical protein
MQYIYLYLLSSNPPDPEKPETSTPKPTPTLHKIWVQNGIDWVSKGQSFLDA